MIDENKWNNTLVTCYIHKFTCHICPNNPYCSTSIHQNEYKMKNAKYLTIKAYAKHGKQGAEQILGGQIVEPTIISE